MEGELPAQRAAADSAARVPGRRAHAPRGAENLGPPEGQRQPKKRAKRFFFFWGGVPLKNRPPKQE